MKILFLTYRFPHAKVAGGHRIVYQRIRYLKEAGYDVGLISFVQDETNEQIETLRPLLNQLVMLPFPTRRIGIRIFHDYLSLTRPAVFWKVYSQEMMKATGDAVEERRYHAVISEFSEMGMYLYKNPWLPAVHTVMSCHRCVTSSYEKYQDMKEVNRKLHYKSLPQISRLRKYEFDLYRSADRVLVLTAQDRITMQYYAQDVQVSVAPSGVDINYLQKLQPEEREPIILMTGYMRDPANEDGVKWFIHHVWPELKKRNKDLRFFIVGAEPSPVILKLAQADPDVVVTGEVDDLRPYRNRAKVFVSPVRLGSGLRIKVLESMAAGLPVVSTSLGMAGIEAQTGLNCLIADTPTLFGQCVDWLLNDTSLREKISSQARDLVEKKHSLNDGLRRFEKLIQSVVNQ